MTDKDQAIHELREQLAQAQETLRAIREGEVDALVVSTPEGPRIFTLQSADQTYRTIVEQMQEGAVILGRSGYITYCNRHFAELVKKPLEQVIGACFQEFVSEADRTSLARLMEQAIQASARGELNLRAIDATLLPVHLGMSPLTLDGQPSICAVITDLTQRNQAAQVLASEQHYRLMFERNPDAVFTLDPAGRFILANPACQRISGYSLAELREKNFTELCAPDQLQRTRANFQKTLRSPSYSQFETALIRKDGRRVEVWIASEPFVSDGQVAAVHCTAKDITELKHSEQLLQHHAEELEKRVAQRTADVQKERQRFLDVLETLPVIVTLIRPDHRIEFTNRAYRDALGDNKGRLCYQSQFGIDQPCDECQAFIPLQTGQPHHWQWTLPNGRTFDIHNFPFLDSDGSPMILEMDIDITERCKAEAALKELNENLERRIAERTEALAESEERLRLLGDNLPQSAVYQYMHDSDATPRFLYVSAGIEELCGVQVDDVLRDPRTIHRLILPEYFTALVEAEAASKRDLSVLDMEVQLHRTDGQLRWMHLHARPRILPHGRVVWDGVQMDITARKLIEARLRDDAQRLAAVLEAQREIAAANADYPALLQLVLHCMSRLTGADGASLEVAEGDQLVYQAATGRAADFVGMRLNASESLSGRCMASGELMRSDDIETDPRVDREACRRVGLRSMVVLPLRYDQHSLGVLKVMSSRASAFTTATEHTLRLMAEFLGVTIARKRIEEALASAKAAAELANRAKDHFLAVLSHELRTPLTPVMLGVSMLQNRQDLQPSVQETLEMIRRNVEMEARLIDDLLDVTRIARGKIELNRNPVDLGSIIQRAVEVCLPDIEARRLHFSTDLGTGPAWWIDADASRLQQVFWNLLKNAIKFTPHGGSVAIRCRPDRDHVVVEVNDTGIGIDPDTLPRLFNAFEQAERSITRQFGGLGLGLAISKALVEMHGGTIEVQSSGRDQGSTFRIRLPLVSPSRHAQSPGHAASSHKTSRPLRILLVEDHGVTAKMIGMTLASEGHQVETAGDVATALALADTHPFDLLLSDLGLPDGNGHHLMRELRARGHQFPGIALSGYGQETDIQHSHQAGFSAHLTKPASRETVLQAIASVTSQ